MARKSALPARLGMYVKFASDRSQVCSVHRSGLSISVWLPLVVVVRFDISRMVELE